MVRDLGFDCSREAGFTKIGQGMWDSNSDKNESWMRDFHKKAMGKQDQDPPPPLPDPEGRDKFVKKVYLSTVTFVKAS